MNWKKLGSRTKSLIALGICLPLVVTTLSLTANEQAGLVLREPVSTIDAHEALIADIVIPANASLPRHQHPGDEFMYMLEGETVLSQEGMEPITLVAGQSYRIPAGAIHTPMAGADGARAIVFRVHPEGEPVTRIIAEGE